MLIINNRFLSLYDYNFNLKTNLNRGKEMSIIELIINKIQNAFEDLLKPEIYGSNVTFCLLISLRMEPSMKQ